MTNESIIATLKHSLMEADSDIVVLQDMLKAKDQTISSLMDAQDNWIAERADLQTIIEELEAYCLMRLQINSIKVPAMNSHQIDYMDGKLHAYQDILEKLRSK